LSNPVAGTFAGLIDGTFGLLRPTWRTALMCAGTVLLPAAALYGWAYDRLFAAYARVLSSAEGAAGPSLPVLAGAFLGILLAAIVQGLAALFVRGCVTAQAADAVRGGRRATRAIVAVFLRRDGARLLAQRVLQGLVYAGVIAAAAISASVVFAAAGAFRGGSAWPWRLLAPLFLAWAALGIVAVWLSVRFSLTLESVVVDGATARQSFGLSRRLVRGSGWRVLGYRLLFAVMLGFVASLVATPIVFFATIRAYARYLSEMLRGAADVDSIVDMLRVMGSGLPVRLAIFQYLQGILDALVAPAFMTLLYVEMKRRRSEGA
jgi:hypothetical protein